MKAISHVLLLLHLFYTASSARSPPTLRHPVVSDLQHLAADVCHFPCHIVQTHVPCEDSSNCRSRATDGLQCIATEPRTRDDTSKTERNGYPIRYDIQLPLDFVHEHFDEIRCGKLHVCLEHMIVEPDQRRIRCNHRTIIRVRTPDGSNNHGDSRERRRQRRLHPIHTSPRIVTKRLLAVRVSSSFGEEPEESLASIQGALFGTGSNPDAIPTDSTVVAQYMAVSHGQLQFVPAVTTTTTANSVRYNESSSITNATPTAFGVLDVEIDEQFLGSSIHDLANAIFDATQVALEGKPLLEVADNFLFCVPSGSLFEEEKMNWTAFTHLSQPVRNRSKRILPFRRAHCTISHHVHFAIALSLAIINSLGVLACLWLCTRYDSVLVVLPAWALQFEPHVIFLSACTQSLDTVLDFSIAERWMTYMETKQAIWGLRPMYWEHLVRGL
jgi:hypothetical protein